jgi:hypothetical protein
MSESQYKAFKGITDDVKPSDTAKSGKKKAGAGASGVKVKQEYDDHSGLSDLGEEGGMSEYDVAA